MADSKREFELKCACRPALPKIRPAYGEKDPRQSDKNVEYYQFKVDNSGGVLAIPKEGISLVIPPDAVPLDDSFGGIIKIGIHRGITSDFEEETDSIALSPTVTLEPHGLTFREPVYLFLPSFAVPKLSRLPDTKLLCSETAADEPVRWQGADERSDKSIVAVYPKHVVVKLKHFCHLKYVTATGHQRPHEYVNVLVFASYQRDSEKLIVGIFVVNKERLEEAMRRGRNDYDVLLTQEDLAIFTDDEGEPCVNVGICDLPENTNPPSPVKPREIATQDIFGGAVRQVRVTIPMRDTHGALQPSLDCNISLRQTGGLNRRIYITRDIRRITPGAPGSAEAISLATASAAAVAPLPMSLEETGGSCGPAIPATSVGKDNPKLCATQSYTAIPPHLKHSLRTSMTLEDKKVLAVALNADRNADVDDLLVMWEIVQGRIDLLIGLANVFRRAGRKEIVAIIEPYI